MALAKTRSDLVENRIILLLVMDRYVRDNVLDENGVEYWLTYGVPDSANLIDYEEIADNDDLFADVVKAFEITIR